MQVKQRQTPRSPAELADAKAEVAELEKPKWYIYDRNDLPDYSGYGDNADRMKAIGEVFPVIFFLVAALISLTTMTRMVEEQRTQIGTLKALGYARIFGICVSGDPSWKRGRYFYRGEDISVYYHQCIRDNV